MDPQLLKGHLDMLLLAVLAEGPKHGYAVIASLRRRSGEVFDLPDGTVYPALHRLEETGCLSSEWSQVKGRPRRTYRITRRGRSALGKQHAVWNAFAAAVKSVLEEVRWPTTP
jgi:DNA-binding PadR family transcriptional regulator